MWQEVGWTDDSLLGLWEEQVVQPKLKAFLVFPDSHGPHLPRAQKMVEHHNPWIVPSQTVVAQRVSPKYDLWHDADIERVRLLHRPTIRLSSTEIQNHLSRQPSRKPKPNPSKFSKQWTSRAIFEAACEVWEHLVSCKC